MPALLGKEVVSTLEALILLGGFLGFVRVGYYAISKLGVFLEDLHTDGEFTQRRRYLAHHTCAGWLLGKHWGHWGTSML